MVAVAVIGAGALGAGASIYSASQASKAQTSAANASAKTQTDMFNKQVELQEPFRQAGLTSQNQLLTLLGLQGGNAASAEYGAAAKPFGMDQFQADPGYAFRMSEGMKALQNSAAAKGLLSSGSTLKGITRFGQDYGTQEYNNAFNRYQTERAARLNPLQSLMGAGQTSANTLTNAAGQLGQGIAQSQMAAGNARASGYINTGNALNNALGTGLNSYMNYNNAQSQNALLQQLINQG